MTGKHRKQREILTWFLYTETKWNIIILNLEDNEIDKRTQHKQEMINFIVVQILICWLHTFIFKSFVVCRFLISQYNCMFVFSVIADWALCESIDWSLFWFIKIKQRKRIKINNNNWGIDKSLMCKLRQPFLFWFLLFQIIENNQQWNWWGQENFYCGLSKNRFQMKIIFCSFNTMSIANHLFVLRIIV